MVVESTGGDPYVHTSAVPPATGKLTLRFRMRSAARGTGQVCWGIQAIPPARAFPELMHSEWADLALHSDISGC